MKIVARFSIRSVFTDCLLAAMLSLAIFVASPLFAQSKAEKEQAVENAKKDWDPGVPKDLFTDGKDGKGNPTHRVSTDCKDCADEAAKLQAALDKWYAGQAAAGAQLASDGQKNKDFNEGGLQQTAGKALVENALGGLGQPADKGAAAKKKPLDGKAKAALKTDIGKLAKALKDCIEKKCPPKKEGPTDGEQKPDEKKPDDTKKVDDGGTGQAEEPPPALPNPIKLPNPPPCFDTEKERNAFLEKYDKVANDERTAARQAREMFNLKYANKPDSAWGVYWKKKQEIHEKSLADLQQIIDDAADNTKTPVPCPKKGGGGPPPPKKKGKTATGPGHGMAPKQIQEEFCALINDDKINVDFTGTGETCGHVADCKIDNLTDQPISCVVPPMVLESKSGKNQDYACPKSKPVDVGPKDSKTVPIEGVCLVRNKPPVGKDISGDLKVNNCGDGDRISDDHADKFLDIATSIFQAVDELLESGELKDIPYKDPEKKKDILVQWTTWANPEISELTGVPPATKDDLKKVVYKQVPGTMTPDTKKKVDQGIDTIFDKVELTTAKAKDLEEKADSDETPSDDTSGQISDERGQPSGDGSQTQEKPKKKWPKPIQKWIDKYNEAYDATRKSGRAYRKYWDAKQQFFEKSNHWKELKKKLNEAKAKTYSADATQADRDARDQVEKDVKKQEQALEKDFNQTEEGKKAFGEMDAAQKEADKANAAEKEAGKNIPDSVKEEIIKEDDSIKGKW